MKANIKVNRGTKFKVLFGMALLIVLAMVLSVFFHGVGTSLSAYASSESVAEKTYSTAKIGENFTDDIILVGLTKSASLEFKSYTTRDFPELRLASVREMTESVASRAKTQIENDARGITSFQSDTKRINVESFRKMLSLE